MYILLLFSGKVKYKKVQNVKRYFYMYFLYIKGNIEFFKILNIIYQGVGFEIGRCFGWSLCQSRIFKNISGRNVWVESQPDF